MTAVDTRGRDRVQGPKELAYAQYGRRVQGALITAVAVMLVAWLVQATQDPYDEAVRQQALVIAVAAFAIGTSLLCARLVIGAMRAAAEASGE